jgi:transcriptional regulator with XRE-family HTH domain
MESLHQAVTEARAVRRLPAPRERRRLRTSVGVSQRVIGEAIGVRRDAVCRYENGTRTPHGDVLVRYVQVLDRLARELDEHDPDGSRGRVMTTDMGDRHVEA